MTLEIWEAAVRVLVAAALSGAVGFERETSGKTAGLRTHMLVGLGSAVFTVLSVEAFAGADPSRVAAQVVTGVGFLGAGAIFRHGISVTGLTTAAGIWTVAGIGMAAGLGEIVLAVVVTGIALGVLYLFRWFEWLVRGRSELPTVMLGIEVDDVGLVQTVCDLARELPGAGEVIVQEIDAARAVVRAMVGPSFADTALVTLKGTPGVTRCFRVTAD